MAAACGGDIGQGDSEGETQNRRNGRATGWTEGGAPAKAYILHATPFQSIYSPRRLLPPPPIL